jgi:hypothetical protein
LEVHADPNEGADINGIFRKSTIPSVVASASVPGSVTLRHFAVAAIADVILLIIDGVAHNAHYLENLRTSSFQSNT